MVPTYGYKEKAGRQEERIEDGREVRKMEKEEGYDELKGKVWN
jgi:hypothetical protein